MQQPSAKGASDIRLGSAEQGTRHPRGLSSPITHGKFSLCAERLTQLS